MNMIKKLVVLIVVLSMIMTNMSNHIVFASDVDDYIVEKTIKVYGGVFNTASELELDITFDARWLINNIESYNKDLSLFALLFSTDMYGDSYANVDANMNDKTLFLSDFGFEDVEYHNITAPILGTDVKDTTKMSIGNKLINISGNEYRLIMVGFEGTSGEDNWISNFDIGSSETPYFDMTGDHVEWLNANNHKGFDVTVNRADNAIADYVDDIVDTPGVEKRYFFTGHSRGASLANIIGAKYIDNGEKALAYTFAAATTTDVSQSVASSYKSIFNIINENDFVPMMPLSNWGFRRYGNDIVINPATNATYKTMIENIKGSEYHSMDLNALVNALLPMTIGRDDYYNINKSEYTTFDDGYVTYEDAEDEIENIRSDTAILQSDSFIELNIIPPIPVLSASPNLFGDSMNVATGSEINEEMKIEEDIKDISDVSKEDDSFVEDKDCVEEEQVKVDELVIEEDKTDEKNDVMEKEEPVADNEPLIEENEEPVRNDEIEVDEPVKDDEPLIEENEEPMRNDEIEMDEHIKNDKSEKEKIVVDKKVEAFNGTYYTTNENSTFEEIVEVLEEVRNEKISTAGLGYDTSTYTIEIKSCPAVMGNTIAFILAHRNDSIENLLEYITAYIYIITGDTATMLLNVMSIVSEDIAALGDPHYIVSYYSIVKNYIPSNPEPIYNGGSRSSGGGSSGGGAGMPRYDLEGNIIGPTGIQNYVYDGTNPPNLIGNINIAMWNNNIVGAQNVDIHYVPNVDSFVKSDNTPIVTEWVGVAIENTSKRVWYRTNVMGQILRNQFIQIGNNIYYFDNNGIMATGQRTINGKVYNFETTEGTAEGKFLY